MKERIRIRIIKCWQNSRFSYLQASLNAADYCEAVLALTGCGALGVPARHNDRQQSGQNRPCCPPSTHPPGAGQRVGHS